MWAKMVTMREIVSTITKAKAERKEKGEMNVHWKKKKKKQRLIMRNYCRCWKVNKY